MKLTGLAAAAAMLLCAGVAQAAPKVVTDIPPVHALVARVMAGVGMPELVVPPGASPHDYAMRPSEARRLDAAEAVVWVGAALTPWFGDAVAVLASGAAVLELTDVPGTTRLAPRSDATFAARAADADPHAPAGSGADADAHDHGEVDPHVWLDPDNARVWLDAIAATLARVDPANAAAYAANARDGQAEIDALKSEVTALLAPVRGKGFVVFHDAYQYFEARFAMPARAAIALSDAAPASAARVAAIRETLARLEATCVFAEPQFPTRLVATVTEGTGARAGVLDPLGAALPPGATLYPALIRALARALAQCLG